MNNLHQGEWHIKECPLYHKGCIEGARYKYPFDFCIMCPARQREPGKPKKPKPIIQTCHNRDFNNPVCQKCTSKQTAKGKSCRKKTKEPFFKNLAKRRKKRKRLLITQNQEPEWRELKNKRRNKK